MREPTGRKKPVKSEPKVGTKTFGHTARVAVGVIVDTITIELNEHSPLFTTVISGRIAGTTAHARHAPRIEIARVPTTEAGRAFIDECKAMIRMKHKEQHDG